MTDYAAYLKSPEWAQRQRAALDRTEHRCQVCNSERNLEVHHRTYERLGEEREVDLTVLCAACHALFHSRLGTHGAGERYRRAIALETLQRLAGRA